MLKIAVVGEGVIGVSTALAIKQYLPSSKLILVSDCDFTKTCSYGPAGIFRLDNPENKFAEILKQHSPLETGVHMISGHIQSDKLELLKNQEECMADIVYNFRWLTEREMDSLFPADHSKYCIHFTTFASEARKYVPWLRKQLESVADVGGGGIEFRRTKLGSLEELADSEDAPDVIVNCAGLNAGKLAGDDDSVYPSRGVGIEVRAPWHKHFNYRDLSSFTIPMVDSVLLGTLRQTNRFETEVSEEDRKQIWENYLKLHPTFKGEVLGEWCGLRPHRPTVRLEHCTMDGRNKPVHIIHNYGHGSNGFTLGWGCALEVVDIIKDLEK